MKIFMTTEDFEKQKINISAGFWRRILALFYDSLLITGIIIGFLLIITFLFDKSFETPSERLFLQISYLFIGFLFFTYFWKVNNGQTLGMQVWKIKVVGETNEKLTTGDLLKRCFFGFLFNIFFGINYLYIFFNREKKSLNDIWSKTKVIRSD
ncbi:MAG: RDD family protein [Gammaproteobacteria bacterium]|nr:MAG: RDD family protein [Gammaproteobacteria bacterium]